MKIKILFLTLLVWSHVILPIDLLHFIQPPKKRIKLEKNIVDSLYIHLKGTAAYLLENIGLVDVPFAYNVLPLDMKKEIIGSYIMSLCSISSQYSDLAQEELEEKIKDIICFSLTNKENYEFVHKFHKPKIQMFLREKLFSWKFPPVQYSDCYGHSSFMMGALLYAGVYDKDCTNFGFCKQSPLNYAIKQGFKSIVLNLLKAGANPNYADSNQLGDTYFPLATAFFWLKGKTRTEITHTLLEYGADPKDNLFNGYLNIAELTDDDKQIIHMLAQRARDKSLEDLTERL